MRSPDGKKLVSCNEMVGKVKAALDARQSDDTLIIARTDARAVEGLEAAIDRAEGYREAGADILFIEPQSIDEMQVLCDRFAGRVPLLPIWSRAARHRSNLLTILPRLATALRFFQVVRCGRFHGICRPITRVCLDGSNAGFADRMHDFNGLNEIIETSALLELGKKYEDSDQRTDFL